MVRLFVLGLICVACSGGAKSKPQPLSERWSAPTMLAQVPADSPYLMAALDPVPEAVKQQLFASTDKKIAASFEMSRTVDRAQAEPAMRAYLAMLDELQGKDIRNWGRELGFDPSGRFVLYGLSVWPVLRIAVANEPRLRQVVTRMLAAAGAPTVERSLRGKSYWQMDNNGYSVIGSIVGGEAVFAVLPMPAVAQFLPHVLGLEAPARSLHAAGSLNTLITRYRLLPTMIGYLDARFAAGILTGRSSSSNTELDKPLRTALGPVSDACRADLERLAAFVPRLVFGYRHMDAKAVHASLAVEMAPAVAAGLQRIRTSVPDLPVGTGVRALMYGGIGADLDELLAQLRRLTTYVHDHPFACSWFAPLGEGAAELASLLDQPLPAPLHGIRGLSVVVAHATKEPLDVRGHAILVGDHAHDLLTLGLRQLLGTTGTVVHPDARPVPLPLASLGVPAHLRVNVAARVDRAAIAIGPASANDVVGALKRPAPAHSPLISFGFDVPRMLEIGMLDPEDSSGIHDLLIQVDVAPEGLLLEMYATMPAALAGPR